MNLEIIETLNANKRGKLAVAKIQENWPLDPESRLCNAIVSQAIIDLADDNLLTSPNTHIKNAQKNAYNYLTGKIEHAIWCGVEPEYIKKILRIFKFLPAI